MAKKIIKYIVLTTFFLALPQQVFACYRTHQSYFSGIATYNSIIKVFLFSLFIGWILGRKNKEAGIIAFLSILIIYIILIGFLYFIYDPGHYNIICAKGDNY